MSLIDYTLHLADDALILGHRNSEWTGHGPVLEQDIAISNIALDLIGQARNFYQYAAGLINEAGKATVTVDGSVKADGPVTEDTLAFLRDGWDFRNSLLVEQSNGDWAKTILRQFFFSNYQYHLYEKLQQSRDHQLGAIASKGVKEAAYHLRWSGEWVIRLGDGTEESHRRMVQAVDLLWKFKGELFHPAAYETAILGSGISVDLAAIQPQCEEKLSAVFAEAGLSMPEARWMQTGGKEGRHTEELGFLLAEMQFMQRAYPGNEW